MLLSIKHSAHMKVREGYLTKLPMHGHAFSNPRRRLFVLTDEAIEWFDDRNPESPVSKGRMPIRGARVERTPAMITLTAEGENLVMRGDDLDAWERSLRNASMGVSKLNLKDAVQAPAPEPLASPRVTSPSPHSPTAVETPEPPKTQHSPPVAKAPDPTPDPAVDEPTASTPTPAAPPPVAAVPASAPAAPQPPAALPPPTAPPPPAAAPVTPRATSFPHPAPFVPPVPSSVPKVAPNGPRASAARRAQPKPTSAPPHGLWLSLLRAAGIEDEPVSLSQVDSDATTSAEMVATLMSGATSLNFVPNVLGPPGVHKLAMVQAV